MPYGATLLFPEDMNLLWTERYISGLLGRLELSKRTKQSRLYDYDKDAKHEEIIRDNKP